MRFVRFSYYKTANRTAPCSAVYYYLWCSAVMLFCERFWCGFCSLCGLVNTPSHNLTGSSALNALDLHQVLILFGKGKKILIIFYWVMEEVLFNLGSLGHYLSDL